MHRYKKMFCACAISCLCAIVSLAVYSPMTVYAKTAMVKKVNATSVNFREEPEGDVIRTLDKGEKVSVLSTKDGWSHVRIGKKKGYICADYLTLSKEDTVAAWKKGAVQYCVNHLDDIYSQEKRGEEGYYDCSSLMERAFYDTSGEDIGSCTTDQKENMEKYMYKLSGIESASYGDIVYHFSKDNKDNHCGIYLGDGKVIDASKTIGCVREYEPDPEGTYWQYGCKAASYCYDLRE